MLREESIYQNMLNDKYIYVFVRQDLTIAQQLVHTNHAVYEMAKQHFQHVLEYPVPTLIVIGMPDEKAMSRVAQKLYDNGINCLIWEDSEHADLGLYLAIATVPLDLKQKELLKDYRLYKPV